MVSKTTFCAWFVWLILFGEFYAFSQQTGCPDVSKTTTLGVKTGSSNYSNLEHALDGSSSTHSTLRAGNCYISCSSGSVSQSFEFDEALDIGDLVIFEAATEHFNLLSLLSSLTFEIIGIEENNNETTLFTGENNSIVTVVGLNNGSGVIEIEADKKYKSIKLFLNYDAGITLLSSAPNLKIYTINIELANLDKARELVIDNYPDQCGSYSLDSFNIQAFNRCGETPEVGNLIAVSLLSGPEDSNLTGTIFLDTNESGEVSFSDMSVDLNGEYTLRFSTSQGDNLDVTFNFNSHCYWAGTVGEDDINFTPTENQNIQIANDVTALINQNVYVNELILNEGAILDLDNHSLTVNGQLIANGGTIIANKQGAKIVFNGETAQNFSGNILEDGEVWEIVSTNTTILNLHGEINVKNMLEILEGTLNVEDAEVVLTCEFLENGTRTAQIEELSAHVNVTGEMTVEQCFQARRAFRFINSPVNSTASIHANWQEGATASDVNPAPGFGTHITGNGFQNPTQTLNADNNGFDWNPSGNPSMFEWNVAQQNWQAIDNTDQNVLTVGKSYRMMLRGDRSINVAQNSSAPMPTKLRAKGVIGRGDIDFSSQMPTSEGHYFLLANPYQAVLDLKAVYNDPSNSNIDPIVWLWDPWLGGENPVPGQSGGRGAWISYDLATESTNNPDTNFDGMLQPYQSVFIRTQANGNVNLIIKEEHKSTDASQVQTFSDENGLNLSMLLYTKHSYEANSTASDGVLIQFTEDGFNGLDYRDAPKMDNLDENMARIVGNTLLSIENRSYPVENENLSLFMNQFTSEEYVMTFNIPDFGNLTPVFVDNYLNTVTELKGENAVIEFVVDPNIPASVAPYRFSIRFETSVLSVQEFENESLALYPNPVRDSHFFITMDNNTVDLNKSEIVIFCTKGNRVGNISSAVANNQVKVNIEHLSSGVYVVKMISDQGLTYTNKILIP